MTSGLPDYHRYIVPSPVVVDAKVGSAFVAEYDSTPEDLTDGSKGPLLVDIKGRLWTLVDHKRIKGVDLKDPTIDESIPMSIENPAIAYDAVNDRFKVDIKALTANEVDISDDWTRQLGKFDLDRVLGATLAHTNPVIARISDGAAFINAAKEDGNLATIAAVDFATSAKQDTIIGHVDTLETLLAGGLPAALDAGALKIKEQSPISGFSTETTLAAMNTKIPSDPAKESGKLTDIDTVLDSIKDTDGIKKITDALPAGANTIGTVGITESVIEEATTPAIYNVTMTNADTEYSQALSANTRKFLVCTRDGTAFRLAFVTGKVATPTAPYFTILANRVYYEDYIKPSSLTLYFACASAGKVVQIIEWT